MVAQPDMETRESRTRFAVCLAAYNGAQFLVEQIDSILEQTGVDLQLFVSVDRSTDGTESRLAQWARTEPRLTLLPVGHRFGSAAPNFYRLLRDIDLTGFDYLSFADQDDVWHPDKLRHAHQVMSDQGAAGYSSNFTAFWPSGKERRINKAWPQKEWDFLFESAGPGCTYVLDPRLARALQDLVRGADDQLLRIDYHDWLAYAFARTHGWRWVIDDWSSMRYRQHANNQIGVNTGWHSFRLRARKVLAGYGFEQSKLIAEVVGASSLSVVQKGLRGGRLGCLWLALQARHCRRKPLDQVWFFISCLLLALRKPVTGTGI
jgi:rhamnosyltransferase